MFANTLWAQPRTIISIFIIILNIRIIFFIINIIILYNNSNIITVDCVYCYLEYQIFLLLILFFLLLILILIKIQK